MQLVQEFTRKYLPLGTVVNDCSAFSWAVHFSCRERVHGAEAYFNKCHFHTVLKSMSAGLNNKHSQSLWFLFSFFSMRQKQFTSLFSSLVNSKHIATVPSLIWISWQSSSNWRGRVASSERDEFCAMFVLLWPQEGTRGRKRQSEERKKLPAA